MPDDVGVPLNQVLQRDRVCNGPSGGGGGVHSRPYQLEISLARACRYGRREVVAVDVLRCDIKTDVGHRRNAVGKTILVDAGGERNAVHGGGLVRVCVAQHAVGAHVGVADDVLRVFPTDAVGIRNKRKNCTYRDCRR